MAQEATETNINEQQKALDNIYICNDGSHVTPSYIP